VSSGKSDTYSELLLNALFNAAAWTIPATFYLALFSVTPTHNTAGTEATGSGYARKSITSNTTNWPTISSGQVITNGVAFAFAQATGTWSSGSNMTGAALMDAASSGNIYYAGDLTVQKPVISGDTASFSIGALTITEQ
jgi:hypothetical protein